MSKDLIPIINEVIESAIYHGGDDGPYFSNYKDLNESMAKLAKELDCDYRWNGYTCYDQFNPEFPVLVKHSGKEEQKETCKMIEDRTEIYCSECGVCMSDEIYYMFRGSEDDFKFCPGCGRKIQDLNEMEGPK